MTRLKRFFANRWAILISVLIAVPLCVGIAMFGMHVFSGETPIASDTPTPSPGGEDDFDVVPIMVPGGSAVRNKPYFDYVNKQLVATQKSLGGASFIDALVSAGFDRTAMQLTPDRTAADLDADSVQFSVQIADNCLIGQWGSGSNGYKSMVAPVVPGIGCLIGETRAIDW